MSSPLSLAMPISQDYLLSELRAMLCNALVSKHSKRAYAKSFDDFFALAATSGRPISRSLVLQYRAQMVDQKLSSSTINVRLSAIRKLIREARDNGLVDPAEAERIASVPSVPEQGVRLGNWLTAEQTRQLLAVPDRTTIKGKRDFAILSILANCALRRTELATLDMRRIQQRDGRWVIADLIGKRGRVRTVAIPQAVKSAIDAWAEAAGITAGFLLRPLSRSGAIQPGRLSDWAVWSVVVAAAAAIGIDNLGAHDLRRTCAKLCRDCGGKLEQIQYLLGHDSIQTTETYLGGKQEIAVAVNDNLAINI